MKWGATVSHRFLQQLRLEVESSFVEVLSWDFDLLRLCIYWDESQPAPDKIELRQILQLLQLCETRHQQVIVTLGMKAPRWPEFYFPSWVTPDPNAEQTQQSLLQFIGEVVPQLKKFSCIVGWQVENEPLDPSGPQKLSVPVSFLEQECQLVQSIDPRPIVLTAWGNELRQRQHFPVLSALSPVVGIDLYEHQYQEVFLFGSKYVGPKDSVKQLSGYLHHQFAKVWVTELQAEPWEKDDAGYKSSQPKSMDSDILREHIQHSAELPAEVILFWGVEYWLWKAQQGDHSLVDVWTKLRAST